MCSLGGVNTPSESKHSLVCPRLRTIFRADSSAPPALSPFGNQPFGANLSHVCQSTPPLSSNRSSNGQDGDEDNIDVDDGDDGGRLYQERTTVHPQASYGGAPAAHTRLQQKTGASPPPAAGSHRYTEPSIDGYRVSQKGVDDTAYTSERGATTGLNMDTTEREHSAIPLASASAEAEEEGKAEAGVDAGGADKNDGDGILIGRETELLYAINFSVAPPRDGNEPVQLSAEVSQPLL